MQADQSLLKKEHKKSPTKIHHNLRECAPRWAATAAVPINRAFLKHQTSLKFSRTETIASRVAI